MDTIIFFITGLEKQARPGHTRSEVRIPAALRGSDKLSLNTLLYLQHYLRETEAHRDYFAAAEGYRPKGLFIANTKVSLLNFGKIKTHISVAALSVSSSLNSSEVDAESHVFCGDRHFNL